MKSKKLEKIKRIKFKNRKNEEICKIRMEEILFQEDKNEKSSGISDVGKSVFTIT